MSSTTTDKITRRLGLGVLAVIIVAAATVAASPASAKPAKDDKPTTPAQIVVKLEPGANLDELNREHGTTVVEPIVASRGIYLLELTGTGTGKKGKTDKKAADKVAKDMAKEPGVVYAEVDASAEKPESVWFHAWPEGLANDVGDDPALWRNQTGLAYLQLDQVHQISTGRGVKVAILDTGADLDHPYLFDRLVSGYDYVDDDSRPDDVSNGLDDDGDGLIDESYGHGTHTTGLVHLVAPDAEIIVYRVLDSDGTGNPYMVAEAVNDAVASGVDVINISFGMEKKSGSKVLKEALKAAKEAGVVLVAAVGNDGDKHSQYPADEKDVIGVGAVGSDNTELAGFSNHGKETLVAAPGENIVSMAPGGRFAAWSGTSMAAPIVTGQVALIRSHDPDRQLKKVVEIVGRSSNKLRGGNKVERGLIDIHRSLEDL